MTWQADQRAVLEFGRLLSNPKVREGLRSRGWTDGEHSYICVDATDTAQEVFEAAVSAGPNTIIMVRQAESLFQILAPVRDVLMNLDDMRAHVPQHRTISEVTDLAESGFRSEGVLQLA